MGENDTKSNIITKLDDLKEGLYSTVHLGKEEIITCFYYVGYMSKLNNEEIVSEIVKKFGEGKYIIVETKSCTHTYDKCCSFDYDSLVGVDYTTYEIFRVGMVGEINENK